MLFNLAIVGVIAYAVLLAAILFFQPKLIYFPDIGRAIIATPDEAGLAYEPVKISTIDGKTLHGWFVPAPAATETVLFFHGNAGNISHRMQYLSMFHSLGYDTFIFDYRGYGNSSGSPSESGTYEDAQAAWQYLTEERCIPPDRIILFGESLGGAIAAWLAAREKPGLLVLASAFTSVPDVAAKLYPFLPVRLLSRFEYNTLKSLQSVSCPVFVAHSPDDEIVPFAQGQALYEAASGPKQFLELQGGHNDGFIFMRKEWAGALDEFVRANLSETAPESSLSR
ncbi:MAG: alpha/beta hydrolase [Betaproteobacteria bacterium]|nr:alpha/beta hydrolase [Betaproteobacteria bacterium]